MNTNKQVSREDWIEARKALLAEEKQLTRARDALAQKRRELPWVKIGKPYFFEGPAGRMSLGDLFGDKSQLIIQHFMFGPDWEEGCVGCSFLADHADSANLHLQHHDVSVVVVARAPLAKLQAYKRRMDWKFLWVSSLGSDFNFDFHVSFTPEQIAQGRALVNYQFGDPGIEEIGGHSCFYRDESGAIFHTYSAFARGDEGLIGAYGYLDMAPKGRNETGPRHDLGDWVRHHDRYGSGGYVDATGRYHEEKAESCCSSGKGNA